MPKTRWGDFILLSMFSFKNSLLITMLVTIACRRTMALRQAFPLRAFAGPFQNGRTSLSHGHLLVKSASTSSDTSTSTPSEKDVSFVTEGAPWKNSHYQPETLVAKQKNNKSRFRQHVNPLSRKFQQPTVLSPDWPNDAFHDLALPLHIDIGCGKGGFLLDLAGNSTEAKNFLGLEIRPSVIEYAQARIAKKGLTGKLDFVGCNANIDLGRLLTLHKEAGGGRLDMVSIQFPDPHFKSSHAKRRVVTADLIITLAKFMPTSSKVFLQSDVQPVLDDMRERFREFSEYFEDEVEDAEEYMPTNPLGIPTEREVSVIDKDLPVYRTIFRRTVHPVEDDTPN